MLCNRLSWTFATFDNLEHRSVTSTGFQCGKRGNPTQIPVQDWGIWVLMSLLKIPSHHYPRICHVLEVLSEGEVILAGFHQPNEELVTWRQCGLR